MPARTDVVLRRQGLADLLIAAVFCVAALGAHEEDMARDVVYLLGTLSVAALARGLFLLAGSEVDDPA